MLVTSHPPVTFNLVHCLQGSLTWTEPSLSGSAPTARKGACAVCTQNRFVVVFGGKCFDADSKEVMPEDLLLLEMEGPSTIKVSSLDIKGNRPPPRTYAMFQVSVLCCSCSNTCVSALMQHT